MVQHIEMVTLNYTTITTREQQDRYQAACDMMQELLLRVAKENMTERRKKTPKHYKDD